MEPCPCGTGLALAECCEPLIKGEKNAETAEALLRSRYTAFYQREVGYLVETIHPEKREASEEKSIARWAAKTEWTGLTLIKSTAGGSEDEAGQIEFAAEYLEKGVRKKHHELAEFKKQDGKWYFFEAQVPTLEQYIRPAPKIGRNDPCVCGSGKKYKKCCGK